jgi:hypothetical protein
LTGSLAAERSDVTDVASGRDRPCPPLTQTPGPRKSSDRRIVRSIASSLVVAQGRSLTGSHDLASGNLEVDAVEHTLAAEVLANRVGGEHRGRRHGDPCIGGASMADTLRIRSARPLAEQQEPGP